MSDDAVVVKRKAGRPQGYAPSGAAAMKHAARLEREARQAELAAQAALEQQDGIDWNSRDRFGQPRRMKSGRPIKWPKPTPPAAAYRAYLDQQAKVMRQYDEQRQFARRWTDDDE